jgi:Family of unknown function (DUF5677)
VGNTVILTKNHPSELADIERAEAFQISLLGGPTGPQILQEQHGWWNERDQRTEALVVTLRLQEPLPETEAKRAYTAQIASRALQGFVHSRSLNFNENKFVYRDLRGVEGLKEVLAARQSPISNADEPLQASYGYPEEWAAFSQSHQEFLKRFKNIENAIRVAFQRIHQTTQPLEKTIYFQGRLIVEDFMEVLLLCGNGYGIGAQKLVRGMYERAVTARYLMDHPDEVENFLDFHRVADYKFLIAIEQSMGTDVFSPAQAAKIRKDYESVKGQFTVSDCKTCGTFRMNHTWSKVDIVSMARKTKNLWLFILPGYYMPMREAHSTVGAIFSRIDPESAKNDEGLIFDGELQRDRAHTTLFTAHVILLDALELQREFFKIEELIPIMQTCIADYTEIWKGKSPKRTREDEP